MGTEDINLKRQKIDHSKQQDDNIKIDHSKQQDDDIDMVQKPSYAQVVVEGVEEEMSDQYWETIHAVANQALLDVLPDNDDVLANAESEDIVEVELPRKDILKAFSMFHDRGIICFFTGKIPIIDWVRQWLNAMVGRNSVEDVYKGPRGFFEVIFRTEEQRDRLLSRLPVFFNNNLVYIVPWRPLAEFEEILKQECPIWVEVECKFSFLWPIIQSVMEKLGKVIVAPNSKAHNRYRLCMLWNTTKKRPMWLNIKTEEMRSFRCQLHWGSFAGHCFKCGGLGHFMAECQQTPVVEVSDTPCNDIVVPNQMDSRKETKKRTYVNIGSRETIVNSEQKGKSIDEGVQESETKERPWIDVGSKGKLSKYHKDKDQEQQRPEMIGSSSNPMGLPRVIPQQSEGKSKPWHRSPYQSNQGTKRFNLRFDKNGKLLSPLEKQPWKGSNLRGSQTLVNTQPPSVQNAFAVLSDYFGDIPEILAQRERDQVLKRPPN